MVQFDAEVTVRRRRYASDTSGWAVLDAASQDGEAVVLVGPLIHLEEQERAHVVGTWVDDSRYGLQVKVTEARPLPPTDVETLTAYLCRVRHIGAKRAASLIDRHGAGGVLDAIDRDPEAAFAEVGLRHQRAQAAAASWEQLRVMRQLHLMLAPHGLGYLVTRIHDQYGPTRASDRARAAVRADQRVRRRLCDRGPDRARSRRRARQPRALSRRSSAPPVRGGAERQHLHAARHAAVGAARAAGIERDEGFVARLVAAGDLARAGPWIYRRETAELEEELAERVRELAGGRSGGRLQDPFADSQGAAAAAGGGAARGGEGQLTAEQLAGVRNAFVHRLSLITGGPGTGKTASIRTIGALAAGQGARVALVAPTGRAALRMTEASGITARTVHSALGWIPGEGPTHDEDDPLPCDLLIVDETSMANLELLVTLLRAVARSTHVVLVGDADQLAPVGAGKPFAELIASGAVATTRLTHIFRQAAGSMIVQGAHGSAPASRPTSRPRATCAAICS